MRYLVTGATGFIGGRVARLLREAGHAVVALVRDIGTTYIGDNGRARRELGWEPRPLEVGLRETLAHEMRLLGMRGTDR